MWNIMVIFIWFISILLLIIYWCWLYFMCKMFWLFSIDVYVIFFYWNISMNCTHFIFIGHLLMQTYFGMENVLEFQYCFWLFTDVDYFSYAKCSYHSWLMFMWFSCTETYPWIANMWSSLVIYWCWYILVCKMLQNWNIAFDYLLMLTICHMQNVLIILDWCLCDFLVLKHIHELQTCDLHWLFTDVDIFWCVKCSRIEILLLIIYWCWLFVICKMFLSFSIDDYVIFLFWNIWINCTHFILIGYLLMLTYFGVENVPEFQYCFWLFTDVDYLSCAKCSYHSWLMIMWFSCSETYASIAYIFISWCFFEIFYACFVFWFFV